MNKGNYSSRFGTADDGEDIFEVMARAFKVEENSAKWHGWHRMAINDSERFRVLEMDGKIIGVAHIARMRFHVGDCEITHGDVGEVSVLPEFQGNGYGSALMRDVVQWMRGNGYDISRLGGSSIFYSRFGYVPFPRRTIEFPIKSVHAGVKIISVAEMFRRPEGLPGEVRPYDASRDTIRRNELYQIFYRGRTGSVVRDFDPNVKMPTTPSRPDPMRIVYEVNGVVEGYLYAGDDGATIYELAFNPSHPDALVGLIKQMLHTAADNGIECVTSRLPYDANMLSILTRSNISHNLFERQSSYASNMIQILNLESLLHKIAPELESRLQNSAFADSSCEIEIGFDEQRVGLHIESGIIGVDSSVSDMAARIHTDHATMMKLIYGMLSFDEAPILNSENMNPLAATILKILFPRQHTASGGWG